MTDVLGTADDHVSMATAADLLAGIGPHAPQARSAQFATGFQPLDDVLSGGIRAQDLVLLGGRPGVGKTVASLQWARWMAMQGDTALSPQLAATMLDEVRRLDVPDSPEEDRVITKREEEGNRYRFVSGDGAPGTIIDLHCEPDRARGTMGVGVVHHIALGVEYDGQAFHGWQRQPGHRSVQQTLEEALSKIADQPIKLLDFAVGPVPELHIVLHQLRQSPRVFCLDRGEFRLGLRNMRTELGRLVREERRRVRGLLLAILEILA